MDLENSANNIYLILAGLVGAGIIAFLYWFKKKNDLAAWMRVLREKAERAETDAGFRESELREADEEIAAYQAPEPIEPVKRKQEIYIHALPKFAFVVGSAAAVITFLGILKMQQEGESNAFRYAGPIVIALVAVAIMATEKLRRHYAYLQQLNRRYLMLKAGGDIDAMLPVINRILRYYPAVAELWMEKADQLGKSGRLDEALEALAKARELAPGGMDLAVVETSYLLRKNDLREAKKCLDAMEEMPRAATDPRIEIYRARLAMLEKNEKKALEYAEKAVELDRPFTMDFLGRDESLKDLASLMRENKLIF